jgi:type III secretion protein N (ATPase)
MDETFVFDNLVNQLENLELTTVHGRITEVVGMLIKAIVPNVKMGEICMIKREGKPLLAEVVGFTRDEVFLSPMADMSGIGPSSEVIPMNTRLHIKVGPQMLGRVLNGMGEPLDEATHGPLILEETYPVINSPPDPLKRRKIEKPLRAITRA